MDQPQPLRLIPPLERTTHAVALALDDAPRRPAPSARTGWVEPDLLALLR